MYTLQDRQDATMILNNAYGVVDTKLYPQEWVEWAEEVELWFERFFSLLSKYAKRMRSAALGMKAIWINLKSGKTLEGMLKQLVERSLVVAEGVTGKQLAKGTFTEKSDYRMPTMKSRASKYRRFSCAGRWN
jgi:hypothetical protein